MTIICGLLIMSTFVGFATKTTVLKHRSVQNEKAMVKVTEQHAMDALNAAKSIAAKRSSTKEELRSAVYNLSEAAMHSSSSVQSEASDVLQVVVRKLQKVDPDGYNVNIIYKYLDDVVIDVDNYSLDQPFVSVTENGEDLIYPYLTKSTMNFSDATRTALENAHVLELEIPGSKEKTRLYIDAGDYRHSELPNQRGHQHFIIDPIK